MEKKQKRYYQKDEIVWIIKLKRDGTVKSINKKDLEMTVTYKDNGEYKEYTGKMWKFDKLKYARKEEILKKEESKIPTVYFSKVRDNAIIPSKISEDAGYDIYACVEPRVISHNEVAYEILCPKGKTTLVPTGIAMAMPKSYYFNCKHERGSTGALSMMVLSGVVDSGYRGEIFIGLHPAEKDVLITNEVKEIEHHNDVILYPYSKAICQGTIDLVPEVEIKEISYEELKKIESLRGTGSLGSSNK